MPEPHLFHLFPKVPVHVLLRVLEHCFAMENLLAFLLQVLRLLLLLREQVLSVDRNVDLDVPRNLGSTDARSLTLKTGRTSTVVRRITV